MRQCGTYVAGLASAVPSVRSFRHAYVASRQRRPQHVQVRPMARVHPSRHVAERAVHGSLTMRTCGCNVWMSEHDREKSVHGGKGHHVTDRSGTKAEKKPQRTRDRGGFISGRVVGLSMRTGMGLLQADVKVSGGVAGREAMSLGRDKVLAFVEEYEASGGMPAKTGMESARRVDGVPQMSRSHGGAVGFGTSLERAAQDLQLNWRPQREKGNKMEHGKRPSGNNGRVLYEIPNTQPGDIVDVAFRSSRGSQLVSPTVAVQLQSSSEDKGEVAVQGNAISPLQPVICPHVTSCGGCRWHLMAYERQLDLKEAMVQRAFVSVLTKHALGRRSHQHGEQHGRHVEQYTKYQKHKGTDSGYKRATDVRKDPFPLAAAMDRPEHEVALLPIIPSPSQWRYRNKMEFTFGDERVSDTDGKDESTGRTADMLTSGTFERRLGMISPGSRGSVFDVDACMLCPEWMEAVVKHTRAWWQEHHELEPYYGRKNTGHLLTLTLRVSDSMPQDKIAILTVSGNSDFALSDAHRASFAAAVEEATLAVAKQGASRSGDDSAEVGNGTSGGVSVCVRERRIAPGVATTHVTQVLSGTGILREKLRLLDDVELRRCMQYAEGRARKDVREGLLLDKTDQSGQDLPTDGAQGPERRIVFGQALEAYKMKPVDGPGVQRTTGDLPALTKSWLRDMVEPTDGRSHALVEPSGKPLTFEVCPESFFQPNTQAASVLYSIALQLAQLEPSSVVVDLYAGTGTLSLFAAQRCHHVMAVELVPEAVEIARRNMEINGVSNVSFVLGDCATVVSRLVERYPQLEPDVVLIDPPRSGLENPGRESILALAPQRIVYASCNPLTQAADVEALTRHGHYSLVTLQPVDQFPHTNHVENIAVLEKCVPGKIKPQRRHQGGRGRPKLKQRD